MSDCKKILYFGLDPSRYVTKDVIVHLPLIQTSPLPIEAVKPFFQIPHSHVLFTSRTAITYYAHYGALKEGEFICVGEATAALLKEYGYQASWVAEESCAEGVIKLLEKIESEHILYPHSAGARPLLPQYLVGRGTSFPLYTTYPTEVVLPNLAEFDLFVFTSPSTVKAFAALSQALPPREKCQAIGPITQNALNKLFE